MSTSTKRFQAQKTTAHRGQISLFALPVLAFALLSISGCVGLTQAGSPATKSSSSSAAAGTLVASAANVNFGDVVAGSNSLQTLTLKNTGSAAVTISQATVTGAGFSLVGSLSSISIPAGQNHSFQIRFSPASSGSNSGSVTIASDATNSSFGIPLSGTGMAGGLAISSQPASQTVRAGQSATFSVVAVGAGTLKYQWKKGGAAISGATAAAYTTPPTTVSESGEQFAVTVSSGEDDDGAGTNVTSNAATLIVDATPASMLDPNKTSLNFSNVTVGSSSAQPVVFTNAGTSQIVISNVSIAGAGYAATGVQSGQILAPGQSTTLSVTFDPSGTGTLPGSVTVSSNATNSPASIALTGIGDQAVQHATTLSWTASASTVSGYNVYRSAVSGGPYTKLDSAPVAATTSVDAAVQAGQTYFYVVTSVESSGLESDYSSEVSATIP
jgi:hypothetical protein